MPETLIALTFDVEEWFHPLDNNPLNWNKYERRINPVVDKILELLDQTGSKGTFFVVGDVAENNPEVVKKIHNNGHEIGSHSSKHEFIYKQTKTEFRDDLRKSIVLLSDLTGEPILSFRAPYFSITKKCLWAIDILSEEGIKYDSSIFPVINHRYGIPNGLRLPYKITEDLWEWPLSAYKTMLGNFPFSGGVYFRFLPLFVVKFLTHHSLNKNEPVITYFHPWEFDPAQPKLNQVNPFLRLRHYHNLNKNFSNFSNLLKSYRGVTISSGIRMLEQKQ